MDIDIETVRLRNLARSDGAILREALVDGVVARNMMNIPYPFHKGAEYEYIERMSRFGVKGIVGYVYGVETLVGTCGLHLPFEDNNECDFEVGLMVFEKYWNQGIGMRAIELLIERAPKKASIGAGVMNDNLASICMFEKLGFTENGECICSSKGRGGEEIPGKLFILKRDD